MTEPKWEKFKKKDVLDIISIDEVIIIVLGIVAFGVFHYYETFFIVIVILWYWLKIRYYERKIIERERDIYNVFYDNIQSISMELINKKTEKDREPMKYDLKQLENKRKFLVDKFVVLNLILVILIELFIKK